MLLAAQTLARQRGYGKTTNGTFLCVSVWVRARFILLPPRDHLGPFLKEVRRKISVKLLLDSSVLGLHSKSLEQVSKK